MHGAIAPIVGAVSGPPAVLTDAADASPKPSADALILAIARERDRQAFAALFQHYAPRLKSYLLRLGADAPLAEELAQEALVAVWRKAALFDPARASASTWIFRIARNLRLDAARRERRPAGFEPDLSDAVETPENAAMMRQRDERVHAALSALSTDQVQVLRMSFFQDQPHAEIAKALELPLGTVKSRIRIALQRLRSALEDEP